jgi:exodeoxyribonuclease VII large subunit
MQLLQITNMTEISLSLSELQNRISGALKGPNFKGVWVIGQISDLNDRGHIYLELVEIKESKLIAKQSCMIWKSNANHIKNKFLKGSQIPLQKDIEILVKVEVEHGSLHGLKYKITDINPAHTVGQLEIKSQLIKENLQKKGIFDKNKLHVLPSFYRNVAVICPGGSAGEADFKKDANILEKYNLCTFIYHNATMQGPQAEESMAAAIVAVNKEHSTNRYDALIIIRGGGANSDLSWLNNHKSALYICHSNMPVITGLGHEVDKCILDEVSKMDAGTPSKTITMITKTNVEAITNLKETITTFKQNCFTKVKIKELQLLNQSLAIKNFHSLQCNSSLKLITKSEDSLLQNFRENIKSANKDLRNKKIYMQNAFNQSLNINTTELHNKSLNLLQLTNHKIKTLKYDLVKKSNNINKLMILVPVRMLTSMMSKHDLFTSTTQNNLQKLDKQTTSIKHTMELEFKRLIEKTTKNFQEKTEIFRTKTNALILRQSEKLRFQIRELVIVQPLKTLERGYAIIRDENNNFIKNSDEAKSLNTLTIDFRDKSIVVKNTGQVNERITKGQE